MFSIWRGRKGLQSPLDSAAVAPSPNAPQEELATLWGWLRALPPPCRLASECGGAFQQMQAHASFSSLCPQLEPAASPSSFLQSFSREATRKDRPVWPNGSNRSSQPLLLQTRGRPWIAKAGTSNIRFLLLFLFLRFLTAAQSGPGPLRLLQPSW